MISIFAFRRTTRQQRVWHLATVSVSGKTVMNAAVLVIVSIAALATIHTFDIAEAATRPQVIQVIDEALDRLEWERRRDEIIGKTVGMLSGGSGARLGYGIHDLTWNSGRNSRGSHQSAAL